MRSLSTILAAALLLVSGASAAHADAAHGASHTRFTTMSPKVLAAKARVTAAAGGARLAPGGGAVAGKGGAAGPAKAKEARCEIVEFTAKNTGSKSLDPKLARWKKELEQPPLSAYDTFKVTGEKTLSLAPGSSGSAQITSTLTVLFKGFVKENEKDRLQLEITVDTPKGKRMYRQTSTQDPGASQILTAGKKDGDNIFFVLVCASA